MKGHPMAEPVKMLALIKGSSRYVFRYDSLSRSALVDVLAEFAEDDAIDFDWFDASVLSQQIETGSLSHNA